LYNAPSGGLGVVWLDGRGMPSEDVGSMQLRSASFDATGKQQGGEALVDDRVCECCSTSVAITADGPLVAYRDRSMDNVRDIHVSRLENGKWTPSVLVHDDGWKLPACPINGPAVAASGQTVAVAWFTTVQGKGHTFVAFSNDAGRTFGAPVQVDDVSSTGRVALALLKDGSAAVTWVEFANEKSQFEVRRVAASGDKSAAQPVTPAQTSGYPRMVRRGDELVLAWTESDHGMLHVKTATAALPSGF
jgi:hypothetical protein